MITENLIFGGILLVTLVLLLAFWRLGRVVFFESLLHPLRKVVISIDSDDRIRVEEVVDRKSNAQREAMI